MSKGLIAFLGIGAALVALVVMVVGMWVTYTNSEARLRNQITAQQKVNEASFDKMWKVIQGQAGVADQYKQAFKDIYPALMEGRYGNARGGALMSFITESNPNFDIRLYEKVSNSIEAQRTIFFRDQEKILDMKREHDNLRTTLPAKIFVGGTPEIKVVIVTSSKTDETFKSGKEDDVDPFKK